MRVFFGYPDTAITLVHLALSIQEEEEEEDRIGESGDGDEVFEEGTKPAEVAAWNKRHRSDDDKEEDELPGPCFSEPSTMTSRLEVIEANGHRWFLLVFSYNPSRNSLSTAEHISTC